MIPFIITGALNLASMACVYIEFWTSLMNDSKNQTEDEKNADAIFTFVTYGLGSVASSFMFGFIQDSYGYKASILLLIVQYLIFYPMIIIQNEL